MIQKKYEAVIVGSGHNALVAACYLAKAGKSVLVIEKNTHLGGATVSQQIFPEYDARLSKYSYLVSLLPEKIIQDLGLNLTLISRQIASYTPYAGGGLLLSNIDETASRKAVLDLGYGEAEWAAYQQLLKKQKRFAELVWDSMLKPLKSKRWWKAHFEEQGETALWNDFVERPIGEFIERHLQSDILRGIILTDARIGVNAGAQDQSLLQNRTFIYHVIGNKTGEWKVPKGGMGALTDELIHKAKGLGVVFLTEAILESIVEQTKGLDLQVNGQGLSCQWLLWNAAPSHLENLLPKRILYNHTTEGTAFKINMLLNKLPTLKDSSVSSPEAFCGTFHLNQSYSQQQKAYLQSKDLKLPDPFPCEMYCHSLSDGSILSEQLQEDGYHTLTVFGLDMPYSLFVANNMQQKEVVLQRFFNGINEYLEGPFEDCIARNNDGSPCMECKSALDLEQELGLPHGNIFHNDLSWFFADNEADEGLYGVETQAERVVLCGSGAKRGGGVSGIPGYLAAQKVLMSKH